jgi:hypothetical protein
VVDAPDPQPGLGMPVDHMLCGLRVRADCRIPGARVVPASSRADVEVRSQSLPAWLDGTERGEQEHWLPSGVGPGSASGPRGWKLRSGAYLLLVYSDSTTFVIDRAGTEVWMHWPPPLTLEDAATYLVGPVLGLLLRLRGVLTLHASAVVVKGYAVAIAGPAGAGKSTTAAAFAQRGFPLLSDDIAALRHDGPIFTVTPSFPQVRLWPGSTAALFGSVDHLPRITPTHPTWDKQYLDIDDWGMAFCEHAIPLGAIYILEDRTDADAAPSVHAMTNRATLQGLVRNAFGKSFVDAGADSWVFETVVRLAGSAHVRVVIPHSDPARLPQMCDAILKDFASRDSSRPVPSHS